MKKLIKELFERILPSSVYNTLLTCYRQIKFRIKYFLTCIKVKFKSPAKSKQERINFGFHIVEHCNLNCASCNNFSPLADVEFLSFESFKRDIERMGILFNHECSYIRLLGGEPLLHPDIADFIKTSRENFHTGIIELITNGTLLANKDKEFWRVCHDYDATIFLTVYPISINISRIKKLAETFNVKLICSEPVNYFVKMPVNIAGHGNYKANFDLCGRANNCPLIYHGKLFTCTFAPNIQHFNKKFGVNIPVSEADYIDIYKETSKEEILRKLSEPIPICRFCNMNFKLVQWQHSKQNINEWL